MASFFTEFGGLLVLWYVWFTIGLFLRSSVEFVQKFNVCYLTHRKKVHCVSMVMVE